MGEDVAGARFPSPCQGFVNSYTQMGMPIISGKLQYTERHVGRGRSNGPFLASAISSSEVGGGGERRHGPSSAHLLAAQQVLLLSSWRSGALASPDAAGQDRARCSLHPSGLCSWRARTTRDSPALPLARSLLYLSSSSATRPRTPACPPATCKATKRMDNQATTRF